VLLFVLFFFFQAEDGIRDDLVTGVQTCALPICPGRGGHRGPQRSGARRILVTEGALQGADRVGHREHAPQLLGVDQPDHSSPRYACRISGSFSSSWASPDSTISPVWST